MKAGSSSERTGKDSFDIRTSRPPEGVSFFGMIRTECGLGNQDTRSRLVGLRGPELARVTGSFDVWGNFSVGAIGCRIFAGEVFDGLRPLIRRDCYSSPATSYMRRCGFSLSLSHG